MDLRDRFAAHVAASLAPVIADAGELARRAYDVAEALIAERARRIDDDEEAAVARRASEPPEPVPFHGVLLDEPMPGYDPDEEADPSWMEPPYDPSWDLDAHWPAEGSAPARTQGPGLARTQPEDEDHDDRKERSA